MKIGKFFEEAKGKWLENGKWKINSKANSDYSQIITTTKKPINN